MPFDPMHRIRGPLDVVEVAPRASSATAGSLQPQAIRTDSGRASTGAANLTYDRVKKEGQWNQDEEGFA